MIPYFRYLSLTHHHASSDVREVFYLAESEQEFLLQLLPIRFPDLTGLLLLCNHNRTEIFFESTGTNARQLMRFLFVYKGIRNPPYWLELPFTLVDTTFETTQYLLKTANREPNLMNQVVTAFARSRAAGLGGHLLNVCLEAAQRFGASNDDPETDLLSEALHRVDDWIHDLPIQPLRRQSQRQLASEIGEYLLNTYRDQLLAADLITDVSNALATKLTATPAMN